MQISWLLLMTAKPSSVVVSGLDADIKQLIQCQHLTPHVTNQLLHQLTLAMDANNHHQIHQARTLIHHTAHKLT